MSLLWTQAMAWMNSPAGDESGARPAKSVGFKGYVSNSGWKDAEKFIAQENGRGWIPGQIGNKPDHVDDDLHDFILDHGRNTSLWQSKATLGKVDISKGVYATQSHLHKDHIDRYRAEPGAKSMSVPTDPRMSGGEHLDVDHPMFVTHQGRLHVIEGHHRVGAALSTGAKHVEGWHYDADKHGINPVVQRQQQGVA